MTAYHWDELRGLSLARQFPEVGGRDAAAVVETVRRVGPIQSQTARSPYAGLAARLPGVTHAAVTEAYESWAIVRGSTIRGTVHTSTADHHALLDATTRVGQRRFFARLLALDHTDLEEVWAAVEDLARDDWRSPGDLSRLLAAWLTERGEPGSAARLADGAGRYLSFGHGGLLRRPISGPWSGQGAAGYRTASEVLPDRLAPEDPLTDVVRVHLASYGPSSRYDVAWWTGLGLRQVDALLDRLDPRWHDAPDGRRYADLPGAPAPRDLTGVRLLPEFDAVLCGYDPRARDRFVAPADNAVLWSRANGLMLAPVLVDGRIGGFWRVEGSGRAKGLVLSVFPGTRLPRRTEVEEPAAALATALDLTVVSVTVGRA